MIFNFITQVKEQSKTFEQLFEHLDKNNSGKLEHQEFITGLQQELQFMTQLECKELIKRIDEDNSGNVNSSEFLEFMNYNVKK